MVQNNLYEQRKKLSNRFSKTKRLAVTLIVSSGLAAGFAMPAFAASTGQNQYGNSFPISSSGFCHGAFANTNGSFGSLGTSGDASSIGGGVPAGAGTAGYDNSAVSGDCTLPN